MAEIGHPIADVVDETLRRIASAEHFSQGSLAKLPLLYPSGASVVVQITEVQDRCFVTDMGLGFQEAEMIGATRQYVGFAESLAASAGVKYDGRSVFIAEVPRDRLAGAMITIANCSQQAANLAAMKIAEKTDSDAKEELFERLRIIFPDESVEKDAPIVGASSHKWKVSVLVAGKQGQAIFEAVTQHHVSIVSAAAKFGDIARLETPPPRIAVVRNKAALGDYLGVIAPAASSVIEFAAANDTYRLLRRA